MEFKPDVPLIIMRHPKLSYQQRAFLLWCWINRDTDERCDLISSSGTYGCNLNSRNITWYANYFGIVQPQISRDIFIKLKKLNIIKSRQVASGETTYVDFTVFR